MALIVEDGTGLINAESYISVSEADLYLANRGMTLWATMSLTEKEWSIRRATDYITKIYGPLWLGQKTNPNQALDWPRKNVYSYDYHIEDNVIPKEIKNSSIELALRAAYGPLIPDGQSTSSQQAIKREKVGPIETEYYESTIEVNQIYSAVDVYLKAFLNNYVGGYRLSPSFGF